MKHLRLLVIPLALLISTCGSDDGPLVIDFETLVIGDQSPINPGRSQHVLNDDPEYEALFGIQANVDFDTETVIAVFLGQLGNNNNSFEITEVIDEVSHILVKVTWRSPRVPSGPATNHYHVIKTRKISRDVRFSVLEVRE